MLWSGSVYPKSANAAEIGVISLYLTAILTIHHPSVYQLERYALLSGKKRLFQPGRQGLETNAGLALLHHQKIVAAMLLDLVQGLIGLLQQLHHRVAQACIAQAGALGEGQAVGHP